MKKMSFIIYFVLLVLVSQGVPISVCGQSRDIYAEYDKANGELRIVVNSPEKITVNLKKSEIDKMNHDICFKTDDGNGLYVFSNLNDSVNIVRCNGVDAQKSYLPYYINDDVESPLMMEIRILETETPEPEVVSAKGAPIHKTIVCIFVLVLVVLSAAVVSTIRRKHKLQDDTSEEQGVMTVVEEKVSDLKRGLEHVMTNKSDYYTIDMNEILSDTAIRYVYINSEAIRKLNVFFREFLESPERTNETGCYMIGCWDYVKDSRSAYDISIEYVVEPGKDAVFEEALLNFGREIGLNLATTIEKMQEKTGREYVRTCWMHSHPGLGLFLSTHDMVVQKQLAYSEDRNRLLAIVIDTNSPDWSMALFCPKHSGEMNNKVDLKKTLSFDDLYKWSKDKKMKDQTNPGFFTIDIGSKSIETINFSGKAINQIDDAVDGRSGVSLYFYGTKNKNDIYIDKCLQYKSIEAIGCLLNETDSGDSVDVSSMMALGCEFLMVCSNGVDIRVYVSGNETICEAGQFNTTLDVMKEWTRRKRF